jgi:superfamily I DNA/RNA helicase
VYIVGVENHQLPGWKALEENSEAEIQEARRLLYVGMTRARDRLVLTRTERRAGVHTGGYRFLVDAGLWKTSSDPTADFGIPPALSSPVTFR